jgi:hypothetical protein
MPERFQEFRFKHLVALFEFCEMRRYSHSRVSLGVRRSADDSFVTRRSNQVDVTKPMLRCTCCIELPGHDESFIKN